MGQQSIAEDDQERWRSLLSPLLALPQPRVRALTPRKRLAGISQAALIYCDDGRDYVVKGAQVGRALVADHVVALLGRRLGAPVPEVALVNVSADLIEHPLSAVGTSTMPVMHFSPGLGHGSVMVPGTILEYDVVHTNEGDNAERFANLAVLYGWTMADDHQFLYRTSSPHLVISHDHGHFFAGGPEWDPSSLAAASPAELDASIVHGANCSSQRIHAAGLRLQALTELDIAAAVAAPPDSWNLDMDERIALMHYLWRRRAQLLQAIGLAG